MIADLHAHYPMHLVPEARAHLLRLLATPLGRARLRDRGRALLVALASRFGNYRTPFSGPRVTVDSMRAGDVRVALSVLYSFFDELALGELYPARPHPSYLATLLRQLELVEQEVAERHGRSATVVHRPGELDAALGTDRLALVHCVEGGFHLGGTAGEVDAAVTELARRGVAYITLAHLVWRHVATGAPALPFMPDSLYRRLFPQPDVGLSDLGRAALAAIVREGLLVDVSHMSERALAETLDLLDRELDPRRRLPVVHTHGCLRFGDQEYGLTEPVLRRLAERDGAVGLIFAQHQLRDGLRRLPSRTFADSFELLCRHIDRIAAVTGSHRHAAIGSDLDGFIKPTLRGLESMADMRPLEAALRRRYGREDGEWIASGNALRVLRAGWRGATS